MRYMLNYVQWAPVYLFSAYSVYMEFPGAVSKENDW